MWKLTNRRWRFWILPLSAVLIAAACLYKLTRTYDHAAAREPVLRCPAAAFLFALPHQNRPIRYVTLRGFLGRHRILLVFFDGQKGAEADPFLCRLREEYPRLKRRSVIVLGISTAKPQENRPPVAGSPYRLPNQPQRAFPFPLLSDLTPHPVHKMWGRYDAATQQPLRGVFLIDRAGYVQCDGEKPKPLSNPQAALQKLLE